MPEPIIKLTDAAAQRVQSLMSKADEGGKSVV